MATMTRREKSLKARAIRASGHMFSSRQPGTGVIDERRHALTWATSLRTKWDDTDLST